MTYLAGKLGGRLSTHKMPKM